MGMRINLESRHITRERVHKQRRRRVAQLVAVVFGLLLAWSGSAQAFSAAEIYHKAAKSVVLIFGFDNSGSGSSGTGSIITSDGLVLTNNHVVSSGNGGKDLFPNLIVYFKPTPITGDNERDLKTSYAAEVVARDIKLDLALLRIKSPPKGLIPVEFGNSEEIDVGENVAAIGHPGGGGFWTLTTGTVSSKRRDENLDIFQTDTAINPGNSGGPLLDKHARLIGINTFVRRVNDQGMPLEGLNYSLRSQLALNWVNQQGSARLTAVSRAEAQANLSETSSPPSKPETQAREFKAADGTIMYGVPNTLDLGDALEHARKEYTDALQKTDQTVRDIERAVENLDNF